MKAGVALMLMLFVAGFVTLSWPSAAGDGSRPRNLFQLLFGGGDDIPYKPRPVKPKVKAKSRKSASRAAPVEEPEAVAKSDTARTVMVIGDFMASGLAEGLVDAYSQNPNVRIIDRSNGSSGFVRNDYYDWPNQAKALIDTEKPAAVVVMLGTNDRQQMTVGDVREPPLSDNWTRQYQARTDALAALVRQRGLPLIWVGLPASKSAKTSSDLLAFNDIYRKSAETVGGTFIDIWDGFVDENGAFVMNGPDMNGQPVRLRGSDGVSLSKPGKRKVAFYVEKPLNKLLGSETVPAPGVPGPETAGPASPANIDVDRTAPMAIDDPELDGGQTLLGQKAAPKLETRTVAEKLVVEGVAPPASPGRADNFGGAAAATSAAPAEAAIAGPAVPETTNAIEAVGSRQ